MNERLVLDKFEREVKLECKFTTQERAKRAEWARKAYFQRLRQRAGVSMPAPELHCVIGMGRSGPISRPHQTWPQSTQRLALCSRYVAGRFRAGAWAVLGTAATGDYGVDLIARKDAKCVAIQCKRYGIPMGIAPVQRAIAASWRLRRDPVGNHILMMPGDFIDAQAVLIVLVSISLHG